MVAYRSPTMRAAAVIACLMIIVLLTISFGHGTAESVDLARVKWLGSLSSSFIRPMIPNNVHITYLKKEPTSIIHFGFDSFLSLYSAYYHMKGVRLFLHTDYSPEEIFQAQNSLNRTDKWTTLALNMPNLEIHYVVAPNRTTNNVEISLVQHKSDFVRMDAIKQYGGTYMDTDVYVLRDFTPLRAAGFQNVVGREPIWGHVNNGIWMSQPNTTMVNVFIQASHEFFDGGWNTVSSIMFRRIAERLHRYPFEVLILDERAWFPTNWQGESVDKLFEPFLDSGASPAATTDVGPDDVDPYQWWRLALKPKKDNEMDFSGSYAIHSFVHHHPDVKNFDGLTPEYVLARQSNFARALYAPVRHAFEAGLFSADDFDIE
ncbi:hypothetical protein PV11_03538 [Exophiala sideris]|uniref:Alpha 1,4-glycosyltransferase domain-containing protein n=2 Tax=Exophiala sideris TaxID=1016849 RepID=A0A0D1YEI1_9EURO|nr:hypothetical protein PV11_03538 [Exophiala sideris]